MATKTKKTSSSQSELTSEMKAENTPTPKKKRKYTKAKSKRELAKNPPPPVTDPLQIPAHTSALGNTSRWLKTLAEQTDDYKALPENRGSGDLGEWIPSQQLRDHIILRARLGESNLSICESAKCPSYNTLHKWLRKYPDFQKEMDEAHVYAEQHSIIDFMKDLDEKLRAGAVSAGLAAAMIKGYQVRLGILRRDNNQTIDLSILPDVWS